VDEVRSLSLSLPKPAHIHTRSTKYPLRYPNYSRTHPISVQTFAFSCQIDPSSPTPTPIYIRTHMTFVLAVERP
jgi:hypothetical protein